MDSASEPDAEPETIEAEDADEEDLETSHKEADDESETPVVPSTPFASNRHDTIVGQARPDLKAPSTSSQVDAEEDEDEEWVDPMVPSSKSPPPTLVLPEKRGSKASSVNGDPSPSKGGSRKGSPKLKDLPPVPRKSREPSPLSIKHSTQGSDTIVISSDIQVPFPSHRRQPTESSEPEASTPPRSSSSTPTSPSASPVNSPSRTFRHRPGQQESGGAYPFPGSSTDEGTSTSSDSTPSSEAWAGDERSGVKAGPVLVPKRERKTTVGKTPQPHARDHGYQKARNGGRTISGGVKGVWKDEDGDDF